MLSNYEFSLSNYIFHISCSPHFYFCFPLYVFFLICLYLIPCFQSEIPSKQPETPDDIIPQKVNHKSPQKNVNYLQVFCFCFCLVFICLSYSAWQTRLTYKTGFQFVLSVSSLELRSWFVHVETQCCSRLCSHQPLLGSVCCSLTG